MNVWIASDIHGSALYCRKLLDLMEKRGADRLVLLGDLLYHGPRNDLPEGYDPKAVFACLQRELLDYARRQGLTAGPVFCTRNGKGMSRTQVTEEIQTLCHDARVEEEKGTPRCLRKLYLATRAEVERGVRLLAEQSYERMLDTEQLAAGWAEGTGHSIHKDVYI